MILAYSRRYPSTEPSMTGLLVWIKADTLVAQGIADGASVGVTSSPDDMWHESAPGYTSDRYRSLNTVSSPMKLSTTTDAINGKATVRMETAASVGNGFKRSLVINPAAGHHARLGALTGTNGGTAYIVARGRGLTSPPAGTVGLWTICERDPGFFFWSQAWHTDGHLYDCTWTNAMKDSGVLDLSVPFCLGIMGKTNQYTTRFGGAQVFNTGTNTFRAPNTATVEFALGCATTGGGTIEGNWDVGEWLIWDHVLDASEIAVTESYLMSKFGL